ncbi:MAG: sulfotransferase [Verrucomicrobia bacterium]|nr:sulfotransferase [Verrucomicrobiota bacterium]
MAAAIKHRWSIQHNYLAGITAGDWLRLWRENGVDALYWHRALFITAVSLLNSFYRRREERLHHDAIARTEVTAPPLFVIGHWRSGTTHLHNLLAQDTAQFAFANTYQVVNPHTFLCTEEVNTRRFAALVPDKRPMDNVALSFQSPQEDEFAPLLLTFLSPYLGISFPRREDYYERYLTFADASPDEIARWKAGFLWFLKKLTLKYGNDRPLVLKSPTHTARIKLLLELFPGARFVHIHRDPYTVFQSFQHYYDTAMWHTYLQRPPSAAAINARILSRYTALYDAYCAQRDLIPAGHFHEIRFTDLERDPVGEMRTLYDKLALPGFAEFELTLSRYVASLSDYEKNTFAPLTSEWRERVAREWRRSFETWNYPI